MCHRFMTHMFVNMIFLKHLSFMHWSTISTEVQKHNISQIQIRSAVPRNHSPQGFSVVTQMRTEVTQQDNGSQIATTAVKIVEKQTQMLTKENNVAGRWSLEVI